MSALLNDAPCKIGLDDPETDRFGICDVFAPELLLVVKFVAVPRSPLLVFEIPPSTIEAEVLFVHAISDSLVDVPFATLLSCIWCFKFEPLIMETPTNN